MTRQMKLGAFLPGGGQHIAAWRHPDHAADGHFNFGFLSQMVLKAEAALFDLFFMADGLAIGFGGSRQHSNGKLAGFEPCTLMSALAPLTKHIGLVATASTTYEDPYTLARKFASVDLLSGGRAGWNVVTTAGDASAQNFNLDAQLPHAQRYARAREHVQAVLKLWNSFDDGAFLFDKAAGRFYDPAKLHDTDHIGENFRIKGPLNVPPSAQRHPVLVQAGSSDDGRDLAASVAEIIFTAHQSLDSAASYYADIKARATGFGRNPEHVLVMPGFSPYIGATRAEAREKYDYLNSLILEEDCLTLLNGLTLGATQFTAADLDGPLPPKPETEGMKSRLDLLWQTAEDNGFTLRQLYQHVATARGHHMVIGTAMDIADEMQRWFDGRGADGFNILPPFMPGGLDDFITHVIPELQNRGLFRTSYEGTTLRENLGLPIPKSL